MEIMVPSADAPANNIVTAPKIKTGVSENVTNDLVLNTFADMFQGIGCLPGEYSNQLNKNVHPVVPPLTRHTPVTEPTDWVSSVLTVPKKDRSVHLCLDPRDLNTAIKHSHYSLLTVQDVTAHLTNSKVFSVLDTKSGFGFRPPVTLPHLRPPLATFVG